MKSTKNSEHHGFTLIELLVVISIIGLLSSVVLASVASARAKAADATIRSNMQTVRSVAEIYYDSTGEVYGTPFVATTFYMGSCVNQGIFADPKIKAAIANSLALVGPSASPACAIGVGGQSWSLSVPLKVGGTWCVGSVGVAALNRYPGGGDTVAADCSATTEPFGADEGGGGGDS